MKITPIIGPSEAAPQPSSEGATPIGNTGSQSAQPTNTTPFRALIDCLNVTFKRAGTTLEEVLSLFGPDGWEPLPYGVKGYQKGVVRGPIKIFYDGPELMGIHVSCPGSGCRDLEARGIIEAGSDGWIGFLTRLVDAGGDTSRIDCAVDDFTGTLSLPLIESSVRSDSYVSRSNGWHFDESGSKGQPSGGKTIYFGKRSSQTLVRIYDKRWEQEAKGRPVEHDHWIRVELECKKARARRLVNKIIEHGFSAVAGAIRSHLEFKAPTSNAQPTRWPVAEWWGTFLAGIEKLRFSVDPITRTIEDVVDYVRRQVAPSLGLIYAIAGGKLIDQIISEGCSRWRDKHHRILSASALVRGAT